MAVRFALPDLGEGVVEAEIERWLVSVGEQVIEDQPMVEVMTDKATVEIPSPASGTVLGVHAAAGSVVPVGTVIVEIGDEGEVASEISHATTLDVRAATRDTALSATSAPPNSAAPAGSTSTPASSAGRIQATPLVRKLAQSLDVDLAAVTGTGSGGRILEADVRTAASGGAVGLPAALPGAATAAHSIATILRREPLKGMRRMIAGHMVAAQAVPTVTVVEEVDLTAVERARATYEIGYLPLLVQATLAGFTEVPEMNATLDANADELVVYSQANIGIAVQTDAGLVVPVLPDCAGHDLHELDKRIAELAVCAKDGKLSPDELRGGTFTITSAGKFGGLFTTPLLNVPQVGILGMHRAEDRAIVVNGSIEIRRMANLSVSFDHRALDGIDASRFLLTVISSLENASY